MKRYHESGDLPPVEMCITPFINQEKGTFRLCGKPVTKVMIRKPHGPEFHVCSECFNDLYPTMVQDRELFWALITWKFDGSHFFEI